MLLQLIILFTLIPLIELIVLLRVGRYIGILNTISIVLLTGITGAFLARSQGLKVIKRIQDDLNMGIVPADKLIDGVMILAGGLLLLTPGFITDFAGFMILIPYSRELIKKWIKRKIKVKFESSRIIEVNRLDR